MLAKMLTLAGSSPAQAQKDAAAILAFETTLAKSSMERGGDARPGEGVSPAATIATFEKTMPGFEFSAFQAGIASPKVSEINNSTPEFFPALMAAIGSTDLPDIEGLSAVSPADDYGRTAAEGVR